jgi:hypothetical protein
MQGFDWFRSGAERGLHRGQIAATIRIVMKTIILPSGNAFGVDDNNGFTALGRYSQPLSRNSVLGVGHSNRAQVANSWQSPRLSRLLDTVDPEMP